MRTADFKNKEFNKTLRGYDVQEVDSIMNDLLKYCHSLEQDNRALQEKILFYDQQEQFIRSALITAEKTAAEVKSRAEEVAKQIHVQAERKAITLLTDTESETKAYRDNIHQCFSSYERELRSIIDHFYTLARKHMKHLENELADEIKAAVTRFDGEYDLLPKPNYPNVSAEALDPIDNSTIEFFMEKENSLLLGRVLKQDILNVNGDILAKKDTIITPELIASFILKGLYGDLILAAEDVEA